MKICMIGGPLDGEVVTISGQPPSQYEVAESQQWYCLRRYNRSGVRFDVYVWAGVDDREAATIVHKRGIGPPVWKRGQIEELARHSAILNACITAGQKNGDTWESIMERVVIEQDRLIGMLYDDLRRYAGQFGVVRNG